MNITASQPGTIEHRAIQHLKSLPTGTQLATVELAEAIGHDASSLGPCLSDSRHAGRLYAGTRPGHGRMVFWRLPTAEETARAALVAAEVRASRKDEHARDRAEDAQARKPRRKPDATPPAAGPLHWKPARPLYEAPTEELEEALVLPEPASTDPAPVPIASPEVEKQEVAPAREQHRAIRAAFWSTGELVIETADMDLVFDKREAGQVLAAVRQLAGVTA